MKNIPFLIPLFFLVLLTSFTIKSAHALTPCYTATGPNADIQSDGLGSIKENDIQVALIGGVGPCASRNDINNLISSLSSASQAISQAMGDASTAIIDQLKLITQPQSDQDIADGLFADQQKLNENYQREVLDAAHRNQDAALAAIAKYKPSQTDCINHTAAILSVYNENQSAKYAQQLVSNDMGYLKNGSPPTVVNAKISDSINQAISSVDSNGKMSNTSLIPYQPDENVVLNSCTNNTCYNNWVIQQENNLYQQTAGNKYPSNAANNPAMAAYRIQYGAWLAERSKNRKIITEADTRMMFKYPDHYTQALNAYQTNTGATASAAATYLTGIYPHADTVGLTAKEMDEAVYLSLLKKTQDAGDSSIDQKALEQAKANYDADEELYRQHELAMDKIVSPPALSASALSVNSGTTAAPAAATK